MIDQRFLTFDGVRLRCVAYGGNGPVALMLHGLYGRATQWAGTAKALHESFESFALDQRGHGRSAKDLADFSREAQVNDAIRTIETIGRHRPVTLVGHAMGGVTAFLAAARRPDLVARLVVVETYAVSTAQTPAGAADVRPSQWPLPFASLIEARDYFDNRGLNGEAWSDVLRKYYDGFRPEFRMEDMQACSADVAAPYDYREQWSSLACPTLVVAGEKSQLEAAPLEEMAATLAAARFVRIANATHDVPLDAPEALAAAIAG